MVTRQRRCLNGLDTLSVSMPTELMEQIEQCAQAEDRSKSNMVCVLIRRGLKASKEPNGNL